MRVGSPVTDRWSPRRMYTLLSGLYKYMFQRDEYCILILGLDNAGKTVRAVSAPRPPPRTWYFWYHAFSCVLSKDPSPL